MKIWPKNKKQKWKSCSLNFNWKINNIITGAFTIFVKAFLFGKIEYSVLSFQKVYDISLNQKNIMIKMKSLSIAFLLVFTFSCKNNAQVSDNQVIIQNLKPVEVRLQDGQARAYFASGCFWCVEAVYESLKGVDEVINGYSGGHTKNPTYEASNTGRTGHAEAVEVIYDPKIISFATLVDVYFGSQNPTQFNGQGPDRGSQYRSIIFYQNEAQKQILLDKKTILSKALDSKVAAEVLPFQEFWVAEDYHQNFESLHPNNRYIRNVSIPRLQRFQREFPHLLKEDH
jgi:peptide-methionine (S)-S-oxide reductase